MREEDAIRAAQDFGVAEGDTVVVQSDGQVTHEHFHAGETSGEKHVDAWAVKNEGGTYIAEKIHSDDD